MKLVLASLLFLAFSGCLDPDNPPADEMIVEIRNAGDQAHQATLTLTGPGGQVFKGKVSVPAGGSYERTWDMPPGDYRAHVAYQFSGSKDGSNVNYAGDRAHTWNENDCRTDAIRVVFFHELNFGKGTNAFHNNGSSGFCE